MASDPLWINAGPGATVGTATIAASTDLLTIAAHGLGDGDAVTVDSLSGGGSALTEGAVYFVRDAATDAFALSASLHGPPVEFASDGGADVHRFAPQYHAAELRRADAVLLCNDTADRFGARAGVKPDTLNAVGLSGTTWTVRDLVAVVYPGLTSQSGPYRVQHPETSGSLDPADSTNDRIDALDLAIRDPDEDAGADRDCEIVYVAGTPAGSPEPPALTANSLRLATFDVPAGGSPSPSVSNVAPFVVASGGLLPIRGDAELPAAGLYDGLPVWDRPRKSVMVRTGSAWRRVGGVGGWVVIGSGESTDSSFAIDVTAGGLWPAGTFAQMRLALRGHLTGSSSLITLRINSDSTADLHRNMWIIRSGTSGGVVQSEGAFDSTVWRIGIWGSLTGNTTIVDLFSTDTSSLVGYQASGTKHSGVEGENYLFEASGRLAESRLVSSLRIGTTNVPDWTSNDFVTCRWMLEGLILP